MELVYIILYIKVILTLGKYSLHLQFSGYVMGSHILHLWKMTILNSTIFNHFNHHHPGFPIHLESKLPSSLTLTNTPAF